LHGRSWPASAMANTAFIHVRSIPGRTKKIYAPAGPCAVDGVCGSAQTGLGGLSGRNTRGPPGVPPVCFSLTPLAERLVGALPCLLAHGPAGRFAGVLLHVGWAVFRGAYSPTPPTQPATKPCARRAPLWTLTRLGNAPESVIGVSTMPRKAPPYGPLSGSGTHRRKRYRGWQREKPWEGPPEGPRVLLSDRTP
jgi:hypothetical protein